MKNIFRILMAVAVLFTASCAKEDISSSIGGGEVEVTFTANLPELGTRAYGDGTQVNTLRYYVYDNEGHFLSDLSSNPEQDKNIKSITVGTPTTVNLVLLKGMTYNIVFWADHDGYYAYNKAAKTITVDYSRVTANEEWRDAFYAYVTIDPAEADAEKKANVTLRRPFAQLNAISTDDMTAHNNANIKLTESTVTLDVYNTFNLATGSVDTNSKVPATHLIANNVLDNSLISMNYFFASANEGYTTNVTLDVNYSNGASYSREFTYVPLKQNYRTNIIGQLLSKSTDFTVTIEEEFGNDEPESTYVATIEDLQTAINNAPVGKTKIVLGADMTGNVTVIQKEGVKIIIDGNNREFDGSIQVHSNSNHYPTAALTIQNVNFETATESLNFIEALENGAKRYSTNITVQNCTFTALATRSAINNAVGVQIKSSKNAKVLNCTATGLHSLVQAQSCDESVLVQNCTVTGKNGVAFKQVKNAVVEGCTITATGYGIRFDGNTDNYGIVVKDNNVTAVQPLIVRKMTGANNSIALEGTNTLNTEADYQIVITKDSDDAQYVKPTGTYTLTGADGYTCFPAPFEVASWEEFTAALAAGEDWIKFTENITYEGNYELKKNIKLDLGGKSITMPMFYVFSTATIKNGTIVGKMYARTGCKVTLENLTYSGTISDDLSTEGHLQVQGGCDVYAKDCTFAATTVNGSQTRSLSIEGSSSGTRKFENCDFKFLSWGSGVGKYKKNVYINTMSGTTTVEFTSCKFNNKAPNILFAGTYSLTNLTMSACDNTTPTLETSRAKDAITDAEWVHISSLIANNKFSKVKLYYTGSTYEEIKK